MKRLLLALILLPSFAFADCTSDLQSSGYKFKPLASFQDGHCGIEEPVRLYATPTTKLSKPIVLECSFVKKVGSWTKDIGASRISHVGGYNCRKVRGGFLASQHSYGNAIDVSSIDGVPISKSWRHAYKRACKYFSTVRTPDHDANHQHHLHIDNGWGYGCLFDIVR